MKRIITMLAIMVMALTGIAQSYYSVEEKSNDIINTSVDIRNDFVSFDADYVPYTLFAKKVTIHKEGLCNIREYKGDGYNITVYSNVDNQFQVSIIEHTDGTVDITIGFIVTEQERETIKWVNSKTQL